MLYKVYYFFLKHLPLLELWDYIQQWMEDLEIHESCELYAQEVPCADIVHFSERFKTQKTLQLVKLKSTLQVQVQVLYLLCT